MNTSPPPRPLEERVAELERAVRELAATVRRLDAERERPGREPVAGSRSPSDARPLSRPPAAARARAAPSPGSAPVRASSRGGRAAALGVVESLKAKGMGFWLGRTGIALLLLGVAFVFKYAVDEGWLTPSIRVAFGLVLGVTLAVIGRRVERRQRWFAPLMFGGAAATFYITGFAAFQLFALVGYAPALGFMVLVTIYTFWAAIHADAPVLAILGAVGGLGTPFLLYTDRGSVAGLVAYTSLVLAGTSSIFVHRGWRSLLWTTVFGGLGVLGVGLFSILSDGDGATNIDRWALQVGAVVALVSFWMVPVVREALAAGNPRAWPEPSLAGFARMMGMSESQIRERGALALTLTIPVAVFFLSRAIWPYPDQVASAVAAGLAAALVIAWWRLAASRTTPRLRSIHAVAASVLLAIALQFAFQNHILLVTWSVEMLALHVAARRLGDRPLAVTAHLLFLMVAGWLGSRLLEGIGTTAVLNTRAVSDAVVISVIAVTSSQVSTSGGRRWYVIAALLALAGWCGRELSALPDGARYVLVAWSLIGLGVVMLGRRVADRRYLSLGHLLFGATACWLAWRLTGESPSGIAVFNVRAMMHLIALGVAIVTSVVLRDRDEALVYRLLAHVLFLTWLWQELSPLPGGHGFVTVSWGLVASGLMLVGLLRDVSLMRKAALATFLAVVAKLFLVDLAQLDPIWRMLLFLGFGGLFLVLSYYVPMLWREGDAGEGERREAGG